MLLTEKQNEIAKDTHRFRVVNAGRRFGKTILAVEEMIGVAVSSNEKRIAYIAPTFQQARDIAWEHLKARCQPIAADINESQLKITLKTQEGGTSVIVLKSWDAIETLRGQKFDFLVLDEVAMMRNFWTGWQEVLRPTLTDTKGAAMFISTPKGFNHFYDLYNLEAEDDQYKSFHATTYDNPYIDRDEIEEAKKQLTEDRFHQEYMGDFRKQEGLVYKEFIRDVHLTDKEPDDQQVREYFAGIDFGYTNPAAVIHIKLDLQGMYWVVGEWYETGRTEAQVADYVKSCGFNSVFADPESPSAIKELNNRSINVREVVKSKDSIVNGIQKVRDLLKQNKIRVHTRCQSLISEFEMYAYDEPRDGLLKEVPRKENDHALDALRYAIMSNTKKPYDPYKRVSTYREKNRNLRTQSR